MSTMARPDRTTMEGMMWNANHVLDSALDPKTNGVPLNLFEWCKGLILISVIEMGFVFSGNVGTGIILVKKEDGSWSPPSAIGLTGVGWGFIAGASLKDVMVFIFDKKTLETITGDAGLKIGAQGELTLGFFGRTAEASMNMSNTGAGGTLSISFSKGLFGGISLEGAIMCPRTAVNNNYYESLATPTQILWEDAVQVKPGSLMPEIYKKLDMLAKGETATSPETKAPDKETSKSEEEIIVDAS